MKGYFLTVLLLVFSVKLQAQEISGIVLDKEKNPVFAANVYYSSSPEKGTTTNLQGRFEINKSSHPDTLKISFTGYRTQLIPTQELLLDSTNVIILHPEYLSLGEVIVMGATPVSEQFSTEKISSLDIYLNPTSQADPLKAIYQLPSSSNNDESANPSLRGSQPTLSKVIYNGVPIYNPVRASNLQNMGFFSIFNPDMIDVQTVYPSNPPLVYGNSTSGIVDINTIRSIKQNQFTVAAGISNLGLSISQKLIGEHSFIQAYGNWQNSYLLKKINDKSLPDMKSYKMVDGGINLRLKLSDNLYFNSFNYLLHETYNGISSMLAYRGDLHSEGRRFFSVNNLSYYSRFITCILNYGYDQVFEHYQLGNYNAHNDIIGHYVSLNLKKEILRKLTMQLGASFERRKTSVDNIVPVYYYAWNPESPTIQQKKFVSNDICETYLYLNWDINRRFSMAAAIRANIPLNDQQQYISYQYNFKYNIAKDHSLIFSGGKYHSYTFPNYYSLKYNPLNSTQLSMDYLYQSDNAKLTAAVYLKEEKGIQNTHSSWYDKVRTLGCEVSFSRTFFQHLTLNFTNSYIRQSLHIGDKKFKGIYNYAYFLKPSITYSNPKLFTVGLSYIGRPGSYIINYPVISASWNDRAKAYEPHYGELSQKQMEPYNRLDLSMSKYMKLKRGSLTVYFSVNNILNIKNKADEVYYNFDYSENYNLYNSLRTFYAGLVYSF